MPLPQSDDRSRAFDVCIVGGAGHVGLPLSIVFASKGLRVAIYDLDVKALRTIESGEMPFMENGAESVLPEVLKTGRLSCSSDPADVSRASAVVVVIGTPVDEFLNPSLKAITSCFDSLMPYLDDHQLVVLRSTVYPGVTDSIARYLSTKNKRPLISFCPERIVQGNALEELQALPQIVSGTSPEAENAAADLFGFIAPEVVRLTPVEAELVKLFSNAYRYIQFAVTNQFYLICESAGVNYYRVLDGMKKNYPRMADVPRAGFAAGPCLFKDTMQLAAFYKNQFSIGHAAMLVNESLPMFTVDSLASQCNLKEKTVGLLGMAFKAGSDDPRSSLSYKLKKLLAFRAQNVLTTDPYVKTDPDLLSLEEVLSRSDVLILCVPHQPYKDLDLTGRVVVDIWNFWQKTPVDAALAHA
jgi:UDP-N-acetyl-D-mannosaminuronic acid dehydrogenase